MPLGEPSLLSEVVQRKETYRGPLPPGEANARFVGMLGPDTAGGSREICYTREQWDRARA